MRKKNKKPSSMATEEAYQHEIEMQSHALAETGASIDENEAYYKACGGRNKSYIYGVGSSGTCYYGRGPLSVGRGMSSIDFQAKIDDFQAKIDDLTEQFRVEREERLLREEEMCEERRLREEEMRLIRQWQSCIEQQLASLTSSCVSPLPCPVNVDDAVNQTSPVTS